MIFPQQQSVNFKLFKIINEFLLKLLFELIILLHFAGGRHMFENIGASFICICWRPMANSNFKLVIVFRQLAYILQTHIFREC